jgi:hypothetical protein
VSQKPRRMKGEQDQAQSQLQPMRIAASAEPPNAHR